MSHGDRTEEGGIGLIGRWVADSESGETRRRPKRFTLYEVILESNGGGDVGERKPGANAGVDLA